MKLANLLAPRFLALETGGGLIATHRNFTQRGAGQGKTAAKVVGLLVHLERGK